MRTLIIGFFSFLTWSALSTHYYVCNIKGLCNNKETTQAGTGTSNSAIANDTLIKPLVPSKALMPGNITIYFAFDKSEFTSDTTTNKYINEAKTFLDQNSQAWLNITGYTDAIGSDEYNQALGYRRAQRMQYYFESKGMPASMIRIESKGEKEPAENNNTATGRANNRRTTITINK